MVSVVDVIQKNQGSFITKSNKIHGRSCLLWQSGFGCNSKREPQELALFNLAIDSKLRGCDLVSLRAVKGLLESGVPEKTVQRSVDALRASA